MIICDAARRIIETYESCQLEAYKCPAGVWTIGYGHTRDPYTGKPDVQPGMKIDKHKAEVLLEFDLKRFEEAVLETCPNANAWQFSAMVCLCFNIGVTAFSKSRLVRLLNNGDVEGAANEFPKWNSAKGKVLPGLVKRRAEERALFLTVAS